MANGWFTPRLLASRVSELSHLLCFQADTCMFDRQCPFRRDCLIAESSASNG